MMPYLTFVKEKDSLDMDTLERTRCSSESSTGGTSGYNSTTSTGPNTSPCPNRVSSIKSPDSVLQSEFSQLDIIPLSYQQNQPQFVQMQNVSLNNSYQQQNTYFSPYLNFGNPINNRQQYPLETKTMSQFNTNIKYEYEATLRIIEHPMEKFRFRYKSEMHGTHGFLYGANSQRTPRTFPEVELCGYKGPAIIRCSLFQANLESPHSHQLIVRNDENNLCDPHELQVSEIIGYFGQFKNMGIIHTAKKYIVEELLKKKRKRLDRDFLTTKEEQELYKQTEKECKDMNLNQVRLCFEAFRVEENKSYTPIASPVYSNAINNRKSAQTGELRIVRLSIATGNVTGKDDLMLFVEKVSKKNIKVRFYEMVEDELVWEAFADFRESDVHHQYGIACRTPAYKDKDIENPIEVFIELVRPSDDERSSPPVSFRYKPRYAAISRKRRRLCSSLNSGSSSNSGLLNSEDLPRTIQEQQKSINNSYGSDEIIKLLNTTTTDINKSDMSIDSDFLKLLNDPKLNDLDVELDNFRCNYIEKDGICNSNGGNGNKYHFKKLNLKKKQTNIAKQMSVVHYPQMQTLNLHLKRIIAIFYDTARSVTPLNETKRNSAVEQITKIINEHSEICGDSLIHEIIVTDNCKFAKPIFKVLDYFHLNELFSSLVNQQNQTALHYACLYGQPNYIRPLLKLGCNPYIQDSDGNTALHIAVREKDLKCLESFINSEMTLNLDYLNDDGFTPLHLAIRDNNFDIVEKLVKFDASSVIRQCSKDGNNSLHMAVQQQNLKLVDLVLRTIPFLPTILYANNSAGHTPLDLAKQLVTSDAATKKILNLLLTFYNKYSSPDKTQKMDVSTGDNIEHQLIIKKEEYSCSSTEDDDEDDKIFEDFEIKEEFIEEEGLKKINAENVELALNNKDTFSKLSLRLNENDTWKKLACELGISAFYLTNAEAFLNLIKRNLKSINFTKLTSSLENIDKSLVDLLLKNNVKTHLIFNNKSIKLL